MEGLPTVVTVVTGCFALIVYSLTPRRQPPPFLQTGTRRYPVKTLPASVWDKSVILPARRPQVRFEPPVTSKLALRLSGDPAPDLSHPSRFRKTH